ESIQADVIGSLEKELVEINGKILELEGKNKEYTIEIARIHEINLGLDERRAEIFKQYHSEKSRLESLRNLTERYDGYGNSIRKVMELKETKKGIIGVVADIIKTEKKYETAIETALGGSIQNIVIDNETIAKDLISYLKKNKYGRATFLPLDAISGKSSNPNTKVLTEKGALGFANGLVEVDVAYQTVANYLLGRILVVDHIDNALLIARKYNHTLRIVTLEGELLNAGGSMTGGAFKNAGNLLGRRREIEELEESVNVLEDKLRSIQKEIETNKAMNANNRKELELIKEAQQEAYITQTTTKMNLNHAIEEEKEHKEEYVGFMSENSEIEQQVGDINKELEDIKEQLATCEEKSRVLEEKVKVTIEELEVQRMLELEQSKKTDELRLEVVSLSQKESFIVENIKRITKDIEKFQEEILSLNVNKENNSNVIKEKEVHIESIRGTIQESIFYREKLVETLKEYQVEKEKLVQVQKESYKKREELSETINRLDKEVYRLTNQKEKLEETLETSTNYMWEEYELTYHGAGEYANDEFINASEMKKMITSLKGKIKELGTVNVNAIEDYKEISERYEFLKIQHNDLIEAEKTLLEIIEDLDIGMRNQFKEKFHEIRIEFDKVFKELFGGGKATLELMEDEDILDAGIKIISQPPGKKLQNMMQLSGGEKALTAISLLFAIQNLKPSPFCLLDEIEAALDDSNVIRFANYLHKLTKNTQFIVITHRRGTMNVADRLYGITMQEKGVSTLVSVNLIEDELEGKRI
ncbi:MAG: chromosome segregation protein SMC, partial [Clostridiales bacterium]|nr:chromosome segregation protein SMC [Clostridiales bacterium]